MYQNKNQAILSLKHWQTHFEVNSYNIHRGSYMSAHVLLNLLNELGKRDKMRGLPSLINLIKHLII